MSAIGEMTWVSPAADAARTAADDLGGALAALSASFQMHAEVVLRAAGAFEAARTLLDRAQNLAAEHGLGMYEDGRVLGPPAVTYSSATPSEQIAAIIDRQQAAEDIAVRATVLAQEALASATEADRDAATALRDSDGIGKLLARIAPGPAGFFELLSPMGNWGEVWRAGLLNAVDGRAVPDRGTDPTVVVAWWASLPAAQQAALAVGSFEMLGYLDGLPAAVRDAANRRRVLVERAALQAEAERLRQAVDDLTNILGTYDERAGIRISDEVRLTEALGKLEALDEIDAVLKRPDRFLLVLDFSGEQLTAAVANGDVDRADHVSVFTPGLNTTVQGSLGNYDRHMDALRSTANRLAFEEGKGTVATVSWLGYEAPQSSTHLQPSRSVMGEEAAKRGAFRLEAFLNGLDGARDVPAHLTALGHSYGSLTTSHALQRGTGVDSVVFFGSPGLGTSDLKDLRLRLDQIFVTRPAVMRSPISDHLESIPTIWTMSPNCRRSGRSSMASP